MRCKETFQKHVFRTPENIAWILNLRKVEGLLLSYNVFTDCACNMCVLYVTSSPLSICHYTLDFSLIHLLFTTWFRTFFLLAENVDVVSVSLTYLCLKILPVAGAWVIHRALNCQSFHWKIKATQ